MKKIRFGFFSLAVVPAYLLARRARQAEVFQLTYEEIPHFDLNHYLQYEALPMI